MKNLGIKYQILLITLIPVFLIDLFFTYTQINSSIEQASEMLQSKGQIIARQIAGASEFNLFTGNDGQIQYLLEQSVDTNNIVLASVYSQQGQIDCRIKISNLSTVGRDWFIFTIASRSSHKASTTRMYLRQIITMLARPVAWAGCICTFQGSSYNEQSRASSSTRSYFLSRFC